MNDIHLSNSTIEGMISPSKLQGHENGHEKSSIAEQLSLVVNSIPAMITYIDSTQTICFINKSVEKTFGVTSGMVVGKHLSALIGEAGFRDVEEYVNRALNGEKVHYETRVLLPFGERFIEAVYTPDIDPDGKVKGYIALVNDITFKKETEFELTRKSRELQDYVENATIGLHWVDANGIIIWANEAEMNMLGYSPEEYIGHPISEFHADQNIITDILHRLGNKENLHQYEACLRCKDGSVKTVLINSNVLWEDEKFIHTRCFTTDITERKKLHDVLTKSENNYREIFQRAPVSFTIYLGKEYLIEFINDFAIQLAGVQRESVLHKPLFEVFPELVLQGYKKILDDIYYTGTRFIAKEEHIEFYKNGNLTEGWFDLVVEPYRDSEGNIIGVISISSDVTEQVNARRKIESSEKKYRQLVDNMPLAMYSCDIQGRITYFNDIAVTLWGYTPKVHDEEIKYCAGKKVWMADGSFVPPEKTPMAKALATGKSFRNVEVEMERPNGERFYASMSIDPITDENGDILGAINIFEDITQRKNAEQELKRSEAFTRTILENSPDCYKILDTGGRLLYMNNHGIRMMEIEEFEPFRNKKWVDFWEGENNILAFNAVEEANQGHIAQFQASCKTVTGKEKWWHVIVAPVIASDKTITQLIAVSRDITEDKLRQKALEESEIKYRSLLTSIPHAIYTCDQNGRINYYNDVAAGLWGFTPELGTELKYCAFNRVWMKDGTYLPVEETPIAIAVKTGRSFKNIEALFEKVSGEKFYALVNITPLLDEKGNPSGAINIFQDISELKIAEQAIKESEARYSELIKSLPAAVYTTDKEGYVTLYNDAAVELWGKAPQIGKDMWCGSWKIFELDGTTQIPLEDCPMAVSLKIGQPVKGNEIIIEREDGSRSYVIPHPQPVFTNEGEISGAVNVLVDVTEQRQNRIALMESEQKYRNLIQALPAAIYTTDAQGVITMYNQASVELWGRKPEIGKDMWCGSFKIFDRDGITEIPLDECPMAVALQEKKKVKITDPFIVETPDGARKWFLPHPEPIYDSTGKMTGAINMLFDVTDHKLAEEQSARLAAIVQSSDDAIVSETLEGIITSWNPAAEKMFGYSAGEVIGKPITVIIPKELQDEKPMILNNIKKGVSIEHHETKRLTKDGRFIDVSLTISPIKDSKGNIIGVSKISRDISVQKRLHEELKEKEEGLRMAVESAKLGTWEYNPVTFKMICSKESQKICGIPDHMEPSFDLILQHVYPEDQAKFIEAIKKAIKDVDDGSFDMLIRIYRYSDHSLRWVRAIGKAFFGPDKRACRLIGTLMDVTEEKEREEKLNESVVLFQTMADNVPAMIWMSGSDKFNDYFNKTWLEYTGRAPEDEANEGWLENVHPEDVQRCIDNYNESYRQQKGMYTEYRLKRHDGQYRWIADNSVPRYNPEGEFVGFISACMDIDDQKRFREKIRDSELLFKTISNASPAALWMTDSDGQNVFVNDTWIGWTGKSFEQQLEGGWLASVLEEDRQAAINEYNHCHRLRKNFRTEFRFIRSDGQLCWGLTEGYPYYDSNGEFAGYAGSVTDITEIKKLEQRKDDFIKMASHELKTPITSINGYVQLLMNIHEDMDAEKLTASKVTVKSSLSTISKQVAKLTRLISELLDLSRIESGQLELHKTEFNLGDLVEEVAQDARHTTHRHAIIVHNEFSGNVIADKDRIAQVFLNLLTNAIKYSPDSDSIEVFVQATPEVASVRVKDTGIGIDKKDHSRIFERFYRVEGKSEQTYPGFGIGLFIASEIVQRHNGSISLKSEKGKGSEFTVTLPLVPPTD